MHWLNNPALEDRRKLYKVLTGKDSHPEIFQDPNDQVSDKSATSNLMPNQQQTQSAQPSNQESSVKKVKFFSVHDRRVIEKFNNKKTNTKASALKPEIESSSVIENCPWTGSIYHSFKSRGLSASLKKDIRENGIPWTAGLKSETIKGTLENVEIVKLDNNFCINVQEIVEELEPEPKPFPLSSSPQRVTSQPRKPNR